MVYSTENYYKYDYLYSAKEFELVQSFLRLSRHYRTKVDSSKKSISFENKDAYIWLTLFTPIVLYSCNTVENMCV